MIDVLEKKLLILIQKTCQRPLSFLYQKRLIIVVFSSPICEYNLHAISRRMKKYNLLHVYQQSVRNIQGVYNQTP
jgi:hypothetical protein